MRLDDPDLLSKATRRHRRGSSVWQLSLHPQKIGDDAAIDWEAHMPQTRLRGVIHVPRLWQAG